MLSQFGGMERLFFRSKYGKSLAMAKLLPNYLLAVYPTTGPELRCHSPTNSSHMNRLALRV